MDRARTPDRVLAKRMYALTDALFTNNQMERERIAECASASATLERFELNNH